MLVLDRIHYRYDRQLVLNGVSLTLAPGQILCLTGPSGCGKTTLMKIAAGSIKPNAGVMSNKFARTACVFQEPRLLPWRTTLDDLAEAVRLGDRILVMSPSPSRIVHQWQSDRSPATRDEAYIYREVARLLALPQIAKCFRLKNPCLRSQLDKE